LKRILLWNRACSELTGYTLVSSAIGVDRTDAKQAEEALRISEARFAGIVSIATDAIISVDEQQRIVIYNEGAERIFGWTRDQILGRRLDTLIPERFREIHWKHIHGFAQEAAQARRMGERRPAIFGLRKNGEEFPADAAISKLHVDGVRLYTVVLRDITAQKIVERDQRFLSEVGATLATSLDYGETLTRIAELSVRFLDTPHPCRESQSASQKANRRTHNPSRSAARSLIPDSDLGDVATRIECGKREATHCSTFWPKAVSSTRTRTSRFVIERGSRLKLPTSETFPSTTAAFACIMRPVSSWMRTPASRRRR
jgi:PAS domain S-box-containing protein